MTFLAPIHLAIALAAAVGIVLLHLITRDRPPRAPLPTARFVPARVEKAMSRATRPTDPLLLLIRVLLVILAGAAFARPVLEPERRAVARVVLLDRSRAVASEAEARDSAAVRLAEGDALIMFDSSARAVEGAARDSLAAVDIAGRTTVNAAGSLSAALLTAMHAARPLAERADSIELVLVSPVVEEQVDAATAAIRALWPGRLRLVRLSSADPGPLTSALEVRAGASDPLGAAAALLGRLPTSVPVRLVRTAPSASDSSVARGGGVLVLWPRDTTLVGWTTREVIDTVGAVVADDAVVVAPFARRLAVPGNAGFAAARTLRVAARWVDGEVAAVEQPLGAGCVRDVAIPLDERGDVALRLETRRLLAALAVPCGGARRLQPAPDSVVAMLAGTGALAASRAVRTDDSRHTPLVPWLLGAALLLALVEPVVRRRGASA